MDICLVETDYFSVLMSPPVIYDMQTITFWLKKYLAQTCFHITAIRYERRDQRHIHFDH